MAIENDTPTIPTFLEFFLKFKDMSRELVEQRNSGEVYDFNEVRDFIGQKNIHTFRRRQSQIYNLFLESDGDEETSFDYAFDTVISTYLNWVKRLYSKKYDVKFNKIDFEHEDGKNDEKTEVGVVSVESDYDDDGDVLESSSRKIYKEHSRYFYKKGTGEMDGDHIFFLKSAPKPIVIQDSKLKNLRKRYSNWDGIPSTINQICRDFKLPRPWFIEIKTILGWTHDSDPFLDSEILKKNENELIEEALQDKRASLYHKFENKKWDEIRKNSEKFLEIEKYFIEPFFDELSKKDFSIYKHTNNVGISSKPVSTKKMLLAPIFDIHVGKMDFRKMDGNQDVYISECKETFNRLYDKIKNIEGLEQIVIPVGSDFFHVDTMNQTTTKGTPQSNNMGMNTILMFLDGMGLAYYMCDLFADLGCEITIIGISGNHDYLLTIPLVESLKQRYKDVEWVNVENSKEKSLWKRKYIEYGKNLIGITHGDELPLSKNSSRSASLMKFMLKEAKSYGVGSINSEYLYFFSGHVHTLNISDSGGVIDIVVPSLAPTDFWHHQKGYDFTEKKVSSYVFDFDNGISEIILV